MFEMILFSLFLTTSIEGIIYAVSNKLDLKTYLTMLLANMILNPTMNLIISTFKTNEGYLTALIIGEVLTVVIESLIYFFIIKKKYPFSLLIAFSANILSFAIGHTINELHILTNEKAYLVGSIIFLFVTIVELLLILLLFIYHHWGHNRSCSNGGSRLSSDTQGDNDCRKNSDRD